MELLAPANREPRTGQSPLGLPPQGRHKGSGLSRVREGPSVPKRDVRRRHPAQASLLDTTWTVARAPGSAAVQTWLRSSLGAADAPALRLAPLTCGGGGARGALGEEPAGWESGLLAGRCVDIISIFTLPSSGGPLVQMIRHDTVRDSGWPVWSGQIHAHHGKNRPSLPAVRFCSQKYFCSNIHLFTTWDLRAFCFLFGAFLIPLKDAF